MAASVEKTKLTGVENFGTLEVDEDISSVCKLCLKSSAKYTCPRCNMVYCSLACYQSEKHSGCSEAFYKDCVVNELSQMTSCSDDKQKVLDMLAKDLEEKEDDESGAGSDDDLAERVEGLDLDEDIGVVWGRLKPKEKEEFARMLQDGRLAHLIELWTPWWRCAENQKLVLENEAVNRKQNGRKIPEILPNIPDINNLLKNNRPSSECKFDLLNVLFSYAFVTRLHNGCHQECPMDSTQDVLESCYVLRDQNRCGSIGEAVQKGLDDACSRGKKSEGSSHGFNLTVLEDVRQLARGPGKADSLTFLSAALSDLICLFQAALSVIKKELRDRRKSGADEKDLVSLRSRVFKAEKKLSFLLSWSQRYGMGVHHLLPHLHFEIETRQAEADQVCEIKAAVESNMEQLKPSSKVADKAPTSGVGSAKIIELD
ncbi:hypothetical protein RRG08_060902 [Elysia crispata]|uniref:HIT-type domain-containing protein n=1 Tax=Elysia crispata TaxID=231223 RepID=A0AAE0Z227_9GAST|nr:hypothetical protein RRG08_060902 [Elysia crispata]